MLLAVFAQAILTASDGLQMTYRYAVPKEMGKTLPAIVVLHDQGTDGGFFVVPPVVETLEEWRKKGWLVVVPDLRGHGKSTRTKDGKVFMWGKLDEKTLPPVVQDLRNLRKALEGRWKKPLKPFVILGLGWGAGVVLNWMEPREVDLLIGVAPKWWLFPAEKGREKQRKAWEKKFYGLACAKTEGPLPVEVVPCKGFGPFLLKEKVIREKISARLAGL